MLIAVDGGVLGSCNLICEKLAEETNSTVAGEVCTVLCDIAGIDAFIHVIQEYVFQVVVLKFMRTIYHFDVGLILILYITASY